jgi:electron transfer flavoprotein beta subunit
MHIAVVLRQVPDLVETLDIDPSGTALDWKAASWIVNECDDHALEQALLLKEADGATVSVVAMDVGDVDHTLYAAVAKGADRILKIAWEDPAPPRPAEAAAMYAEAIAPLGANLVLVGVQAHNELDGVLPPWLATALQWPYVGVIRGVQGGAESGTVIACKEFPGAVRARLRVRLPAVLGVLGADQPPRYVPVSRIRGAMQSAQFEEPAVTATSGTARVHVRRLYPPVSAARAEILSGSARDVATRMTTILAERGILK